MKKKLLLTALTAASFLGLQAVKENQLEQHLNLADFEIKKTVKPFKSPINTLPNAKIVLFKVYDGYKEIGSTHYIADKKKPLAVLYEINVIPPYRKKGLGRQLAYHALSDITHNHSNITHVGGYIPEELCKKIKNEFTVITLEKKNSIVYNLENLKKTNDFKEQKLLSKKRILKFETDSDGNPTLISKL